MGRARSLRGPSPSSDSPLGATLVVVPGNRAGGSDCSRSFRRTLAGAATAHRWSFDDCQDPGTYPSFLSTTLSSTSPASQRRKFSTKSSATASSQPPKSPDMCGEMRRFGTAHNG